MRNGIWRKHHDWTPESDDRLSEAVEIYGTDNWPLGYSITTLHLILS